MHARATTHERYIRHGTLRVPARAEKNYEAAKAYLCADPVERRLFHELERAHGERFRLSINRRNDDHFDPNSNTIAWDPYSALRTTNGGSQSPALGLGHEVDHAVENPRTAERLRNTLSTCYDNAEERRVITGSEAHAARTLSEAVRHDHAGRAYRVASPIVC